MFKTPMKGLYVKNINCFFFLIEKNANTSMRIWSILNFCENQDIVEKTRVFLKENKPQEFSRFFHEISTTNKGHICENLKYHPMVHREEMTEYAKNRTKFFGFLRDPVERAISVYGDKLIRLIPESEQLSLGGKDSEMLRKAYIAKLREYVAFMNVIKYVYASDEHIREYEAVTINRLRNASVYDRHIRQQYELIAPLVELILSLKAKPHMSDHLFLLDVKNSNSIDDMLYTLTHFETKDKFEKIKMRASKQKYGFTKEEKEEIKKILASDYAFLERTNEFTYTKNE